MKIVLIIMPQFSPSSYPVVHRARFFTNHLEEFGWKPIVLTVEPQYLEEEPDWEFHKLIPKSLEIIRTPALSAKWTRKFGVGDLGIRSLWHHLRSAKKICKERKIDLLFIPAPPWHPFLIGPMIKKSFKIPYILDYTDPWVSSMGEYAPLWKKSYWFRKMAIWLEPFVVRHADHIVSVSDGTNEGIRSRYPFLKPEQFTSIPLGGEASDFEAIRKNPTKNNFFKENNGFFNFVYTGAMLPKAYGTLRTLFSALKKIEKDDPSLYSRIRLHFIGTTYAVNPSKRLVTPVAEEMGLSGIIYEYPKRVPYLEASTLLKQADAILAFGSAEPHYTASKIYPCILADRPLLAIYHEASSVVDVMKETKAGEVITYSTDRPVETKIEQIASTIKKMMRAEYAKPKTNWQAFEKYSARNMTKRLVDVFNCVLKAGGSQ